MLSLVGLSDKMSSLPDELSGGEQQRVSIARAVVNHPPLLICDEPTGNLDPDTSVGIMQLLYRINRAGTTILMVTHDREMVDKMRRRVTSTARDERRVERMRYLTFLGRRSRCAGRGDEVRAAASAGVSLSQSERRPGT